MKYERFTQWTESGASLILENPQNAEEARTQLMEKFKLACNKLAELEDKIEQGTLIELPFITQDARGDWRVHFYSKRFNTIDCYVYDDREEAEKRLKELCE